MADLTEIVRKTVNRVADEQQYKDAVIKLEAVNSEGANYTSALYTANISSPNKQTLNLFAKIANVSEILRKLANFDELFRTETIVYEELTKIYEEIQIKANLTEDERFVFPKCYAINSNYEEETMVLENLIADGYQPVDRNERVDWNQAEKAMELLAKFHALSFAFEKENPEEFERLANRIEKKDNGLDSDEMNAHWKKSFENETSVIVNEELKQKTREYVSNFNPKMFMTFGRPVLKRVFIHGDYRPSNMMYKVQNGITKYRVVDFQVVSPGCVVADLMYYIGLATDEEFRKKHYFDLLELYYTELTKALKRLQVDPQEVYPKKVFKEELKQMQTFMFVSALILLPTITVEAQNAPDFSEFDAKTYPLKTNQKFAKRFNEIVRDSERLGIFKVPLK